MFFQGSRAKKYFVYFKTDNEEKTNFQPFEAGSDNASMAILKKGRLKTFVSKHPLFNALINPQLFRKG